MITCNRCGRPAPIPPDELLGDGGGDPALMVVLIPPDGWIGDPDDPHGGIICVAPTCATVEEMADWMDGVALVEQVLARPDE